MICEPNDKSHSHLRTVSTYVCSPDAAVSPHCTPAVTSISAGWAAYRGTPLLAGRDLLQAKLAELLASHPRVLVPDRLLHGILSRLALDPDDFPGQHEALCAYDPRLQPGAHGRPVSVFFLPLLSTAHSGRAAGAETEPLEASRARGPPSAEQRAAMADMAKPRSVAGLLEELGYDATASEETVRELLQQVR